MENVSGIGQTIKIDEQCAALDVETGKKGLVLQGAGPNLDPDAAHELEEPWNNGIDAHGQAASVCAASVSS